MSTNIQTTDHDPRNFVDRMGFFAIRPAVLEEYIWDLGLPRAAERVFFLHWVEGKRSGDWCSEIPLKVVAARCRLDESTVTKAYQVLIEHDLIRRDNTRRDPNNRFQQAVAITEVRIPRALTSQLSRMPRRQQVRSLESVKTTAAPSPAQSAAIPERRLDAATIQRQRAVVRKLTGEDGRAFMAAVNTGRTSMTFSPSCLLNSEERKVVSEALEAAAGAPRKPVDPPRSIPVGTCKLSASAPNRRLSLMEYARLQSKVRDVVPDTDAAEAIRQVAWSIQNGSMRAYPFYKALNTAAKLIREGAWTRPSRMPPNWTFLAAVPETCVQA